MIFATNDLAEKLNLLINNIHSIKKIPIKHEPQLTDYTPLENFINAEVKQFNICLDQIEN